MLCGCGLVVALIGVFLTASSPTQLHSGHSRLSAGRGARHEDNCDWSLVRVSLGTSCGNFALGLGGAFAGTWVMILLFQTSATDPRAYVDRDRGPRSKLYSSAPRRAYRSDEGFTGRIDPDDPARRRLRGSYRIIERSSRPERNLGGK